MLRNGSRLTTTCITSITNQRVKECNGIKAIIDELGRSLLLHST